MMVVCIYTWCIKTNDDFKMLLFSQVAHFLKWLNFSIKEIPATPQHLFPSCLDVLNTYLVLYTI